MEQPRQFHTVLITGITGFVGSHLADFLLAERPEIKIIGLIRWRSPRENIRHIAGRITLEYGDMEDSASLTSILSVHRPDAIFHLAAQSYVDFSFRAPMATLAANVLGTCNLLEAVKTLKQTIGYDPIIHICSSSEVYGQVREDEVPIKETNSFRPASPYAVSKVGEDMLALQYWLSWQIKTIRTRMFTHSVSKWTPVFVRNVQNGLLDILYISEIRMFRKKGGYLSGTILDDGTQIWDMARSNLEVWNDHAWSRIKHISCHPIYDHKMIEIACRKGVVDVTDNHSLIDEHGNEIKAGNISIGEKIKLTPLPQVEITNVSEEMAWLFGFFVAEGCVTGGKMRIDNKDRSKLERAQKILLTYFAIDSRIENTHNDVLRLSIRKPFEYAKRFYKDCYASDKNKKIPKIILNADQQTKIAFLRGYNAGDGDEHHEVTSEFYRFKTKSPILAAGLCYITESVLGVSYRIHTEHRGADRYFEIRCLAQHPTENGSWLMKDDNSITKITELSYEEEVWDFETENHWFHGGVGGVIVHNTGPRRGEVFALSNFAKQVAAIEAGKQEPIVRVGNLDSVRTWMDVRDAVRAYWLLVTTCEPGEVYNIGGVETMTIGNMLEKLLAISARKDIRVEVDPSRLRPSDVTLQIAATDKFMQATGWKLTIPFETTIKDTLDYWRNHFKHI